MDEPVQEFWSIPAERMLEVLDATPDGLESKEAADRLKRYGSNLLKPRKRAGSVALFFRQFKSPIIIILIGAAIVSIFLGETTTATIIIVIVFVSGALGFWQERGALNAVQHLLAIVEVKTAVLRDGDRRDVPVEEVVPGDVVLLDAGDIIPADSLLLESNDLYVDEAALTGETFPIEKEAVVLPADTPLARRANSVFMGTHVVSGTGSALVVHTGKNTEFGKVSERLGIKEPETEFEKGVKRFGYFLLAITVVLVVLIFILNVALKKPVLNSFLFSLALAVGLTPQLLPAIISINLAKGSKRMADQKVIVKRLESIENFGSMDILCSDKTGTITEGTARMKSALDASGGESDRVWLYAYLNSTFETGFSNPLDEAVRTQREFDITGYEKLDEVPYDFNRRRLSIVVSKDGRHLMITKGAIDNVLDACTKAEKPDGSVVDIGEIRDEILAGYKELSGQGLRTIGVAYRDVTGDPVISAEDETDMTFLGTLALFDPPKQGIASTIERLSEIGVSLKVITGDNHLVASNVGQMVGLANPKALTGTELGGMSEDELTEAVLRTDIFAEVEPNQKELIIESLRKAGKVVGFMGDGINDASAIHMADVGISVDSAVDVAKEAADFVLLEKDLGVLVNGVMEGRVTFANTMKYVFMATSANFGNMFSMAGASVFLKFLPLLPGQVLMTNLMTDFPEMTIATDSVDPEMVEEPRRWDIKFIMRFMLVFGILSSVFDYLTFATLLWVLNANEALFRTGWFVESVISASMIVLVIRTRRLAVKSRPGTYLLITTLLVWIATLALPYMPFAKTLGFERLPASFYPYLGGILVLYFISAEIAKYLFYRWTRH